MERSKAHTRARRRGGRRQVCGVVGAQRCQAAPGRRGPLAAIEAGMGLAGHRRLGRQTCGSGSHFNGVGGLDCAL